MEIVIAMQYSYRIVETISPYGRYIFKHEFKWLMTYFNDRYDPRRLAIGLMVATGLRTENAINVRIKDFRNDFSEIHLPECKPHTKLNRKKDMEFTNINIKWFWMPLPPWLQLDLSYYIRYRAILGYYIGEDIKDGRMFPKLKKIHLRALLYKLRIRYGDKNTWLKDVWRKFSYFDKDRNLLKEEIWYRISCHGLRAFFCTEAYDICEHDLIETKGITNHTETKNLEKYARAFKTIEKKEELRDRVMTPLVSIQNIPILKGQKMLLSYINNRVYKSLNNTSS